MEPRVVEQRPLRAPADEVNALLGAIEEVSDLGERIGAVSALFLGRPYLTGPLVGGPEVVEELVSTLDGFDCVTFQESTLALGRSRTADDFERELVAIRYHHGQLAWHHRNHYTSDWFDRNVAEGFLEWVAASHYVGFTRRLSLLAGYPVRERRIRWLPADRAAVLQAAARTGDLVAFGSTRDDLDTTHVGLLIQSDAGLRVRHASRSAGAVTEHSLIDYLSRNQPPGLLITRPLSPGGST